MGNPERYRSWTKMVFTGLALAASQRAQSSVTSTCHVCGSRIFWGPWVSSLFVDFCHALVAVADVDNVRTESRYVAAFDLDAGSWFLWLLFFLSEPDPEFLLCNTVDLRR